VSQKFDCPLGCGAQADGAALGHAPPGLPGTEQVPRELMAGAYRYTCPRCSEFALSILDDHWLTGPRETLSPEGARERDRVLAHGAQIRPLLREASIRNLPAPWLQLRKGAYWPLNPCPPPNVSPVYVWEFLDRWPRTIRERLDRALANLGGLSPVLGTRLPLEPGDRESILFARNDDEAYYIVEALRAAGSIEGDISMGWRADVTVSPAGWDRISALESGAERSSRNPAFVAMWFGAADGQPETTEFMSSLFERQIKAALKRAGYRAERVDLVPNNDFVMDKIIGMIRAAPFVVADFTGNRNGVYFEAGFARGLGIPVLHTCRTTHFAQAHFDVQQIATTVWDSPEELAEKLYWRVMGSLGAGPYVERTEEQ
jgi:hypothetical protein